MRPAGIIALATPPTAPRDEPRGGRPSAPGHAAGQGRARRATPRRSRSSRMTRAAATRSGSCEMVRASQSMYEGSNEAISPSAWSWNFPNATTVAIAASSVGGSGARQPRTRRRWVGPVGSEARSGSPPIWMGPGSTGPRCLAPGPVVVAFRGRSVPDVSRRPVTGREGGSGGGPDRWRPTPASVAPDGAPSPVRSSW